MVKACKIFQLPTASSPHQVQFRSNTQGLQHSPLLSPKTPPINKNNVSGLRKCCKGLEKMKTLAGWMQPAHAEQCRHRPACTERLGWAGLLFLCSPQGWTCQRSMLGSFEVNTTIMSSKSLISLGSVSMYIQVLFTDGENQSLKESKRRENSHSSLACLQEAVHNCSDLPQRKTSKLDLKVSWGSF